MNYSDYNTVADSNIDKQKLDDLEKKEHAWIKNVQSRINPINNNLGITSPETMGYNQLQPLNFNSPMHIEYQQPDPAPAPTSARAPAPTSARAPAPTFAPAVVPTLAHAPAHAPSHALSLLHVPAPAPALAQTHVHNQLDYNNHPCVECDKTKITFKCTLCDTDFGRKSSLMKHNKRFHQAFQQNEKGTKRKSNFDETHNKRIKSTRGVKRKLGIYSVPSLGWIEQKHKKPRTELTVYEPYSLE